MDTTQIATLAAAGIPLEAWLEHNLMPKINSSAAKTIAPYMASVAAITLANMAQGQPWQLALGNAAGQALLPSGVAMAVHGTPIGAAPSNPLPPKV